LIGAAVASYYFLFKPRLEEVDKARADWEAARQATITEAGAGDTEYKKALAQQEEFAIKIFEGYHKFRQIQLTMPEVYNMKERFKDPKEGIYEWYRIMGSGSMIRELNRWAKSFHLPSAPSFSYSGTMGYEETLPGAKMVGVNFGNMNFKVRGLRNLTNSLRRVTGHDYFPMIVSLGDAATIKLNLERNNPQFDPSSPSLTMPYSATAYFLTRGWDPGGYSEGDINALEQLALSHPSKSYKPQRTGWIMAPGETKECPPVLFFIKQPDMEDKYRY